MSNYAHRSNKSELIDAPGIPFNDWAACLRELNIINTWLGGHKITTTGVQQLLPKNITNISIAEIGCGGGDNLKAIHHWNKNKHFNIQYTGIDLNEACIDFARKNCQGLPNSTFIHSDYSLLTFDNAKPDIIFSSLFCHHFTNEQLVEMLIWLKQNSKYGFVINDLHRHPIAYHLIKWITLAFSKSYLVKYDAPLSVLRGFSKKDWEALLHLAGIQQYDLKWKWAFRHLITVNNE